MKIIYMRTAVKEMRVYIYHISLTAVHIHYFHILTVMYS